MDLELSDLLMLLPGHYSTVDFVVKTIGAWSTRRGDVAPHLSRLALLARDCSTPSRFALYKSNAIVLHDCGTQSGDTNVLFVLPTIQETLY